jgi:hypothetical protein
MPGTGTTAVRLGWSLALALAAAACGGGGGGNPDVVGRDDGADLSGDTDVVAADADGDAEAGPEDGPAEADDGDGGGEDDGGAGCRSDGECDDGVGCTTDSCDLTAGRCVHLPVDPVCTDGDICNGVELCDPVVGCVPGAPVDCSDGIDCTVDSCDALTGGCRSLADSELCTAPAICDPAEGGCVEPPACAVDVDCDDGIACTRDRCLTEFGRCGYEPQDALCDDGYFCTGAEACDPASGCVPGARPGCDDGIPCTADNCDNGLDECRNVPDDARCSDGQFCNGDEVCAGALGCVPGVAPSCDDGLACSSDGCDYLAAGGRGACMVRLPDLDGDTYPAATCTGTDCNDTNAGIYPGAGENCNGLDDDCDGATDETFPCARGTTTGCRTACGSTGTQRCLDSCSWSGCTPPGETCNGVDDDCDGAADNGFECAAGALQTTSCGFCATQSRSCSGSCGWLPWGPCTGGGECSVGATESRGCACGGTESRSCGTDCLWGSWSGCPAGACTPGWSRSCTTSCDPPGAATGYELCTGSCSWSGVCIPPGESCNGRDDDCDGVCDDGWSCCAGRTLSCTTVCGTPGSGVCTSACGAPVVCCAAGETCGNLCDDNCNGLIDEGCIPRRILVLFESCSGGLDHITPALANLGLSGLATFTYSAWELSSQLMAGPWDLVVVDEYSNGLDGTTMDLLRDHVAAGRPLIFSYWDLPSYSWHELLVRAGVGYSSSYWAPIPIYRWVYAPLFTTPNAVPDFSGFIDTCNQDGHLFYTTTATAQAGYTGGESWGQAAITLSADRLVLLNGFTPQLVTQDFDWDGKPDMVELYENEIDLLF